MSSARHTPRYVPLIGPEPTGPQLVGPEPAPRLGPHPAGPKHLGPHPAGPKLLGPHPLGRRESTARHVHVTEVIPLRPLAPQPPAEEVRAPGRKARRQSKPVAKRPWTVLIMSASATAPTRTFDLARWHARAVIAAVVITLLLSGSFVAAVVTAVRSPELVLIGDEATEMRARLSATEDSLAAARAEIALRDEAVAVADSLSRAMVITSVSPTLRSPAPGPSRRPSFSGRLRGVSGTGSSARGSSAGMGLPVVGVIASQFSRSRRHPLLHIMRPHLGLDLAAPSGTPVSAPAPGVVSFVGRRFAMGLTVEITHANGVRSRYLHLRSASVQVGQHVLRGALIAAVGSSGLSTGPHLHYEVLVNGHQVNPLHYRYAANEAAAAAAAEAANALASRGTVSSGMVEGAGTHGDSAPGVTAPGPR
jgi:murein DD-endopeptidase MepM/ murein hydrolase activator NlpD